ncbi:hypothetical protein [Bradyrhizobium sp. RT10b]|uniref:hypothetical protein n=1 Tax=Bradyrhizobium sp. RT10b TaxID=3156331 RepID=UPI003393A76C
MRPYRPGAFPIGAGHRTPATLLLIDERDRYLREAAARYCIGMSNHQAADFLRGKLIRYRAAAWQREYAADRCPTRHRDKLTEILWLILKTTFDAIPSDRTVRAALARGRGVMIANVLIAPALRDGRAERTAPPLFVARATRHRVSIIIAHDGEDHGETRT